jgi:hypothetical protein
MRHHFFCLLVTLLITAAGLSNPAWAADQSIDDAFSAMEKSKGSSKAAVKGVANGFDSLDRLGQKNGATGHGIEAGFKDVEADRAAKDADRKRNELQAMQQNARKEDQEMEASCKPKVTAGHLYLTRTYTCIPNELTRSAYIACQRQNDACYEMSASECNALKRERAREEEAEQAASRRAAEQKKTICDAWKASGGKANSKEFLERLRSQEQSISNAQRAADQVARERDELIAADKKAVASGTRLSGPAEKDAAISAAAAKKQREDRLRAEARSAQAQKEIDDKQRAACVERYDRCECTRFDPKPRPSRRGDGCTK